MKTEKAANAIRNGGFLMAEFDADDQKLKYRCVPGGGVTPHQAKRLIADLSLQPQHDTLFAEVPSQTWRP